MSKPSKSVELSRWAALPAKGLVHIYRLLISPVLPASCRYAPSCSEYALEALTRHGIFAGGWYTLKRLGRCHPWGGSGYDPVPGSDPAFEKSCDHDHNDHNNNTGEPHLAGHRH